MSLLIADGRLMRIGELDDPDDDQPEWLGSPGTGDGQFEGPIGVAARPSGGFVIADSGNHRLVGVASIDGSGWETFGSQGSDPGCFERPSGVAVDSGGRIYVADSGNSRIVRIDNLGGDGWEQYGSRGAPSAGDPAAVGRFRPSVRARRRRGRAGGGGRPGRRTGGSHRLNRRRWLERQRGSARAHRADGREHR